MKKRRRSSARVPRQRLAKLFGHRRDLERRIDRIDRIIGIALIGVGRRNVDTSDVARTIAVALGDPLDSEVIGKLTAALRQRRSRAAVARKRKDAPSAVVAPGANAARADDLPAVASLVSGDAGDASTRE